MAKRRVRLNDENDPLSSTDKVLAGFEQVSKSNRQQGKKLTIQEANKSTSQQGSNLTTQEANKSTSQQDSNLTSQEVDKLTSQEDKVSTSQQSDQTTISQNSNLTSHKDSKSARKQVDFSTSQKVKSKKSILRKSTFQINSEVLGQLDRLHLTLQLEMGKSNAPYKEVIVEEALVRLLEEVNSDRKALIEALLERHKSRDKI